MARPWSVEVGDAKSVIEPLVGRIDPDVAIEVDGGEGFRKDTVEVRLRKSGRQALCIVTFEAWANAKTSPSDMEKALREIIGEVIQREPRHAYLLTSRGLAREPAEKHTAVLRDIAAATEADVLAEQFFQRSGTE